MKHMHIFKPGPKMVFIDLDETLLNTDKMVDEENKEAIREWLDAGNKMAISTGRSPASSFPIMEELGFTEKGCYLVAFQGGAGFDASTGEQLFSKYMDTDATIDLLNEFYKNNLYAQTFNDEMMLAPNECDNMMRYWSITRVEYKLFSDTEELRGMKLYKVIAVSYDHPEELVAFQERYRNKTEGIFETFFSCPYFLEYAPVGSGKGVGNTEMAKILGIPKENTIAIGDERNDISMIEAAGIGVCMANGHEEAKAVADYITENDNNHNGVAEVLRKYI